MLIYSLYEAEFLGQAKPIKKRGAKKEIEKTEPVLPVVPVPEAPKKRQRKAPIKKTEPVIEVPAVPEKKTRKKKVVVPDEPKEVPKEEPEKKVKKPRTEKQVAAFLKAQEARKQKKEKEESNSVSSEAIDAALAEPAAPKRKRKSPASSESGASVASESGEPKKRKKIVLNGNDNSQILTTEEVTEPKKRVRKVKAKEPKDEEPPAWFKNLHLDEAKRQNSVKPKTERYAVNLIKEAASSVANKQWSNGLLLYLY